MLYSREAFRFDFARAVNRFQLLPRSEVAANALKSVSNTTKITCRRNWYALSHRWLHLQLVRFTASSAHQLIFVDDPENGRLSFVCDALLTTLESSLLHASCRFVCRGPDKSMRIATISAAGLRFDALPAEKQVPSEQYVPILFDDSLRVFKRRVGDGPAYLVNGVPAGFAGFSADGSKTILPEFDAHALAGPSLLEKSDLDAILQFFKDVFSAEKYLTLRTTPYALFNLSEPTTVSSVKTAMELTINALQLGFRVYFQSKGWTDAAHALQKFQQFRCLQFLHSRQDGARLPDALCSNDWQTAYYFQTFPEYSTLETNWNALSFRDDEVLLLPGSAKTTLFDACAPDIFLAQIGSRD